MIDDYEIIDFHGHVGRWDALNMVADPVQMLRSMDAVGIDMSCLFNIFQPEGTIGNNQTSTFVSENPDRFIGFAYVSPTLPYSVLPELERAIDQLNFKAIKIYPPYTPFPLDHAAWDPVYDFANERDLAIIAHTGNAGIAEPAQLGCAAARFPKARFVAGHSGNIEPYRSQAIEAAQQLPNYYLETCSTYRTPGVIEELVSKAGAHHVLFGSDIPLMDPRPQLGKIITANIDTDAKRLILGENARALLHL